MINGPGKFTAILMRVASAAFLALVMGCAIPPFSDGRPPPTDRLSNLKAGVSGEADVRAALGDPRGNGMIRHSSDQSDRRPIWYYEFAQVKGDQVGLKILLVFFYREKYDGHIWFAANELMRMGEP